MKRESIIIKELAVIERKLKEVTNDTAKEALRKKRDRLKAELKDPSQSTNVLAKKLLAEREAIKQLSKIDFNDLVRRLSKKPEYAFLKTMPKGIVRNDIERKAKPVGWRFKGRGNYDKPTKAEVAKGKKSGTVYREVRPRRSDVSFVARLKDGGNIVTYQEKRYKKQPNGKWLEISKHGLTKQEHSEKINEFATKPNAHWDYNFHMTNSNKLSGKEYTDKEIGLNKMKDGGDVTGKYCVVMSGGSIGEKGVVDKKGRKLVDTFETREEAAVYAKRRNSQLSPGEKTYYKIKFYICPYNPNDFVTKMKDGGALKPIPKGNKGLPKLPKEVRNKMGFMKHGGILTPEQETDFNAWMEDGNVVQLPSGDYATQDAQWSNRLSSMDEVKKYYKKEFLSYFKGGDIDSNLVIFSVNDEALDSLLQDHHGEDLDYTEISGDSYYTLNRKDFERFLDAAMSKGFDVDYINSQDSVIDVMNDGSSMYAFGGLIDENNISTGTIIRMSELVPQEAEDNMISNAQKVMNDLLDEGFEKEEVFSYIAHILVKNVKDNKTLTSQKVQMVQEWSGEYSEEDIADVLNAYERTGVTFPSFFVTVAGPTPEADSTMVWRLVERLPEITTNRSLTRQDIKNITWGVVMAARQMTSNRMK